MNIDIEAKWLLLVAAADEKTRQLFLLCSDSFLFSIHFVCVFSRGRFAVFQGIVKGCSRILFLVSEIKLAMTDVTRHYLSSKNCINQMQQAKFYTSSIGRGERKRICKTRKNVVSIKKIKQPK